MKMRSKPQAVQLGGLGIRRHLNWGECEFMFKHNSCDMED